MMKFYTVFFYKVYISILVMLMPYLAVAQSYYFAPTVNQHDFFSLVNPAFTGLDNALKVGVSYNKQWNIHGLAPTRNGNINNFFTKIAFAEFNIPKIAQFHAQDKPNKKERKPMPIGVGLTFFDDKEGILNTDAINFQVAWHIKIDEESNLSAGLNFGYNQQKYENGVYISNFLNGDFTPAGFQEGNYRHWAVGLLYRNRYFTIGASGRSFFGNSFIQGPNRKQDDNQLNFQQLNFQFITSQFLLSENIGLNLIADIRNWNKEWQHLTRLISTFNINNSSANFSVASRGFQDLILSGGITFNILKEINKDEHLTQLKIQKIPISIQAHWRVPTGRFENLDFFQMSLITGIGDLSLACLPLENRANKLLGGRRAERAGSNESYRFLTLRGKKDKEERIKQQRENIKKSQQSIKELRKEIKELKKQLIKDKRAIEKIKRAINNSRREIKRLRAIKLDKRTRENSQNRGGNRNE